MTCLKHVRAAFAAVTAILVSAGASLAADNPEAEPNETKAQATPMTAPLNAGDTLSGTSLGTSTVAPGAASADTFLVQTAQAPLGIYEHRLVRTSAGTNGATIRGLNQTAGVIGTTDSTMQTAAITPHVQWYGFGKGEQLYFRVTGTATTTAPYVWTLQTTSITATDIGNYQPGQIVLNWEGQGHSTDTDIWVYDGNLNAIPDAGNDDNSIAGGGTGGTLQSRLTRDYAGGTYYVAVGNYNTCNNLPSPPDDDFRTGIVLDFQDAIASSSTTVGSSYTFTISDSGGASNQILATRPAGFDVVWFKFVVQAPAPFGACCLNTGACLDDQSASDCANAGGVYRGDGTDCSPNPCPQPGACCLGDGACQTILASACSALAGSFQGEGSNCGTSTCTGACCLPNDTCIPGSSPNSCNTAGGVFRGPGSDCSGCDQTDDTEPNDNKPQATNTGAIAAGHRLVGTSTGTSTTVPGPASADYFKITTATAPLNVYRHRLLNTAATANVSSIRGLTQTAGVPNAGTDASFQASGTASTPPRHLQWYGFGKGEMIYVSITGATTTTAPYEYTLETTAIAPTVIPGNFAPGQITITTVGQTTTDTDFWVYDGNLNAIVDFGNDDEGPAGATLQSRLVRDYPAGTYYLAMGDFNVANNLGSPPDDDFRTGAVLDFADAIASGDRDAAGQNLSFMITDANGSTPISAFTAEGDFEILWFKFVVGNPCPGQRGDANCDGAINFFDIDPFVLALFELATYQTQFCSGSICTVDVDCSGAINFFDIDPFVACLFSSCPSCP